MHKLDPISGHDKYYNSEAAECWISIRGVVGSILGRVRSEDVFFACSPCRNGDDVLERSCIVTTRIGDRRHMCWRFYVFCNK